MSYQKRLINVLVIFGVSLLSVGCGEPPIEIASGNTFSSYDNQFRVLRAERYTQSHTSGGYIYYDEAVFVVLEWKCLKQSGQRCSSAGSFFSLFDKERNRSFDNITFKDQVINQFDIPISADVYNCCNLIDGGDTYQVYLLFTVDCSRNLVLKFSNYLDESGADATYYAELPDRIQCKR